MKICITLGTRPEIIKMAPVIKECKKRGIDFFVIHSNQHYSENLDRVFFEELGINTPKYNLGIGSGSHGNQTGNILIKVEEILMEEKPRFMLAQGDTNTVVGAALAATKLDIKVGHIEAGLRSYNRRMPEETNRTITDHVSDYLFCPTEKQKKILKGEGIEEDKIFVVGNTIVDAVFQNLKIAEKKSDILDKLDLEKDRYFLVTAHRALNVDLKQNLIKLIDSLKEVSEKFNYKVIFPTHPRTKKKIDKFKLDLRKVKLTSPLGYFDFLCLEKNARLILTDSGGVQEEACILKVPCVTLREETERPETVEVGANTLVGIKKTSVLEGVEAMMDRKRNWKSPFGDGDSADKIIDIITNEKNS